MVILRGKGSGLEWRSGGEVGQHDRRHFCRKTELPDIYQAVSRIMV
jgi:hypothetical protein